MVHHLADQMDQYLAERKADHLEYPKVAYSVGQTVAKTVVPKAQWSASKKEQQTARQTVVK
jgi:hypothetical protein